MKKTVSVNVGSYGFTIDEDAYQLLKSYLQDIGSRLSDSEQREVLDDVESRIADIFRENTSFSDQVVGVDLVRRVISIIGRAADFGEVSRAQQRAESTTAEVGVRRLYRSRSERVISGVCGGLALYLNIDVTLVRVIAFVLMIFGGASLWVYIIMWIIVPQEPMQFNYFNGKE